MGRKRSKRKAESKKKREPLDKKFNCPFCNLTKSPVKLPCELCCVVLYKLKS